MAVLGVAWAAPSADEVKSLPGWDGALPSKHYSGFLDASITDHLHYVFVEASAVDPSTAPVSNGWDVVLVLRRTCSP